MNIIDSIKVEHTPLGDNAENIIINGKYWGQRHHHQMYSQWYVVTSPNCLEWNGVNDYVTDETVLGVYVDEHDYDLTVRQLYKITQNVEVPF